MDTWTISTSQAIPDLCRSKVGPGPFRGRFGALRGWGGKKSTSRNLTPSYSKWVHRLPYRYSNAFQPSDHVWKVLAIYGILAELALAERLMTIKIVNI